MNADEMRNGHPVIKDMPAPRLFQTEGGLNIRIALPYEKSATGTADIYVHKACVAWAGDNYVDAKFDVLLIDEAYRLYYPVKDSETGLLRLIAEEGTHPVEEICDMCQQAKLDYQAHPIKVPKQPFWDRDLRPPEQWATVHPNGMLHVGCISESGDDVPWF